VDNNMTVLLKYTFNDHSCIVWVQSCWWFLAISWREQVACR